MSFLPIARSSATLEFYRDVTRYDITDGRTRVVAMDFGKLNKAFPMIIVTSVHLSRDLALFSPINNHLIYRNFSILYTRGTFINPFCLYRSKGHPIPRVPPVRLLAPRSLRLSDPPRDCGLCQIGLPRSGHRISRRILTRAGLLRLHIRAGDPVLPVHECVGRRHRNR